MTATILGIVAIVLAVLVPFTIERLKRPKLEIIAVSWQPIGPTSRTFAVVHIRNKPVVAPFRKLLTRDVRKDA
jgi:hypothetical protein